MQASLRMFCFKPCHMLAPVAQPTRNRESLSNPLAQPTRNGDSLTNPLAQPTRNTETLTNHHNKASAACRPHSTCSHLPTCPRKQKKKQQKKPKTSFVCTHVLVTCYSHHNVPSFGGANARRREGRQEPNIVIHSLHHNLYVC